MQGYATGRGASNAGVGDFLRRRHHTEIIDCVTVVQESRCHVTKIQNNSKLKMKDPVPIRLRKQARMCQKGPIDRFQCQGNKFLA